MSATDTVQRVLRWAGRDQGPPPPGDLRSANALLRPAGDLAIMWPEFARLSVARMYWNLDSEPDSTIGTSGLLLAAALGILGIPKVPAIILNRMTPVESLFDAAARHRLVSRTLPFVANEMADLLRDVSPLTSVLERPTTGKEPIAFDYASQLLRHPDTRRTLVNHIAQPTTDVSVRKWRASILNRWRVDATHLDLVLDVYEAASVYFRDEHGEQIRRHRSLITRTNSSLSNAEQEDLYSLSDWWEPLMSLERTDRKTVRKHTALGPEYLRAFEYVRACQRLRGA